MKQPITVYFHSKGNVDMDLFRDCFEESASFMPTFNGGIEVTTLQSFSETKHLLSTQFPDETYYLAKVTLMTIRERA